MIHATRLKKQTRFLYETARDFLAGFILRCFLLPRLQTNHLRKCVPNVSVFANEFNNITNS